MSEILWIGYSDAHYNRSKFPPRHLVHQANEPKRGHRAPSLCGIYVNASQSQYDPKKWTYVCKKCLKKAAPLLPADS